MGGMCAKGGGIGGIICIIGGIGIGGMGGICIGMGMGGGMLK